MAKKKKKPEPQPLPKLSVKIPGLGGKREASLPVDELAKRTGISAPVLAGLKTAYGWGSHTKLTQADFNEKTRSWLNAGGK